MATSAEINKNIEMLSTVVQGCRCNWGPTAENAMLVNMAFAGEKGTYLKDPDGGM